MKKCFLFLLCIIIVTIAAAQKKTAIIIGKVINENEEAINKASVIILGKQTGIATNDTGYFKLTVPAEKAFALVITAIGYKEKQQNFLLSDGEQETVTIRLQRNTKAGEGVTIIANKRDDEVSLIKINPKNALSIPTPIGGIESLIKIFVGDNNELTSQYQVRGGNYDENLIYVNDFEIYRPYLVSNGQQEGLSFINPQMASNVYFQLGGFQAKYGDKMSSVLDITYRKPKQFGGSAYVSLLEQGIHFEGANKKNNFSYLIGARSRTNSSLLGSQETKGNYQPSSRDVQAQLNYKPSAKVEIEGLVNLSQTKFTLIPDFSQKSSSVFSPLFSANLGLDIYFEGQERDVYKTNMFGLATTITPRKNLKLKFLGSRFQNNEKENYDIIGAYLFGERDFDNTKPTFGQIVNALGVGAFQNYARNTLNVNVTNVSHKGSYDKGKHYIQWGAGIDKNVVNDKLNEYEMHDSTGYTLPFNPNQLQARYVLKSSTALNYNKFSGYIQDNYQLGDSSGVTIQAGVRFNYNQLNNQFLLSPRISAAWKPQQWERNFIFKAAVGAYAQPPFYREMRQPNGVVNTNLKAQQSIHYITGTDYNFKRRNRPFKFTAEAYYKSMTNVVPYDVDNVRLRYFGQNNAKAYAMGAEVRLFGELVKDAESWVSLGIMQTKENINNDYYYNYKNAAGEIITRATDDRVVADSVKQDVGWLRRPTDRLITFGLFFSDYLSTNKNIKVYLNTITGTNMPYNLPNNPKYRNALIVDPYLRVDLGFSALLIDAEKMERRSHAPFKAFKNVWLNVEVFNLIDRRNQISFLFIKDFSNTTFSIPNRLTPRLLNVKLFARW
jgi:hypothetical protein